MRKTINQKMMNVSDEDGVRDILSQVASVTTIVKKHLSLSTKAYSNGISCFRILALTRSVGVRGGTGLGSESKARAKMSLYLI